MDSPGNVTYNKISERQDSKKMPERGGHEKVQQRKHTDGAEDGMAVCTGIIFVALVGMVDSLMVSRVGAHAVAAVGLTTQPKFIGLAVFIAVNVSVSALVARRKGQENQKGANEVLCAACFLY